MVIPVNWRGLSLEIYINDHSKDESHNRTSIKISTMETEMPNFSDSEMFLLDHSQEQKNDDTDQVSSNAMVMGLLSSIKLDRFDDQASIDSFQFDTARAQSPFQQILSNNAMNGKDQLDQRFGLGGDRVMGSASPLSHMYSPLSEPGTPIMNMGQLDSIQNLFDGSFGSFDGSFDTSSFVDSTFDPTFDPSNFDQAGYESDPQVHMFGSPQMSEYSMNSPPMTPMARSMTGSPLMQSYSHPIDTQSILGFPDMSEMSLTMSPPVVCLNNKKEKVYKCGCGKTFKKLVTLELHSKLHQSNRAYGCNMCGKRFLRPHDLKRHKITHIEGYKPFECTHCGVTFTRQDAMYRHINSKRCH